MIRKELDTGGKVLAARRWNSSLFSDFMGYEFAQGMLIRSSSLAIIMRTCGQEHVDSDEPVVARACGAGAFGAEAGSCSTGSRSTGFRSTGSRSTCSCSTGSTTIQKVVTYSIFLSDVF
ncbi:hypothetical protein Tco_1194421 [Tanacetum coccineum]